MGRAETADGDWLNVSGYIWAPDSDHPYQISVRGDETLFYKHAPDVFGVGHKPPFVAEYRSTDCVETRPDGVWRKYVRTRYRD